MNRVKVGIVGCGNISGIYLTNLTGMFKGVVDLVAVCDIIPERADAAKEKYNILKAYYTDEDIMADPEIQVIVNLTTPDQHAPVNLMALNAGKHAYCEKPLATSRVEGEKQVALAKAKGLMLGGAPDTYLGGGIQTCRKLIDDGWIGEPVAANALMRGHGHETWHPDPAFYYKVGGGPMFDMGPYYLTALINLIGPVKSVAGSTRITFPTRTITSEPKYGTIVDVEVPTHVVGIMNFCSGAIGTITTSFDVYDSLPVWIEIFGSRGTLRVPDPNGFGGPIHMLRAGSREWETVPVAFGYQQNSRGLGVADLCAAINEGRNLRGNFDQTFHVLDLMCGFHDASNQGKTIELQSKFERMPGLVLGAEF
ncbi:MAG: Gfo/Idh/MocA family oxidoreductase [Oscillospiraceae bacterium]|nr:Gfo/Idh/MocA family oxidoreductase [Oscillospiraceae bacterium]